MVFGPPEGVKISAVVPAKLLLRESRGSGHPSSVQWIPACAGMTHVAWFSGDREHGEINHEL